MKFSSMPVNLGLETLYRNNVEKILNLPERVPRIELFNYET